MSAYDFEGICVFVPVRTMLKRDIAEFSRMGMPAGQRRYSYHFLKTRSEGAQFWLQAQRDISVFPQVSYCFTSGFLYNEPSKSIFGDGAVFQVPTANDVWNDEKPHWDPSFIEAGMIDPTCPICLSAVMPYVILVDRRVVPESRIPRSWEDLASPLCHGLVASADFGGEHPGDVAISYATIFGDDLLAAYANNLVFCENAMRLTATFEYGHAGIYVVPWSYARSVEYLDYAMIVWPAEGAFVMPVWVAFKRNLNGAGKDLARYFLGQRYAALTGRAGMPSCVASNDARLAKTFEKVPVHNRYCWMGWKTLSEVDPQYIASFGKKLQKGVPA